MQEYYLFLDETSPQPDFQFFCLGGYFISKDEYENALIPRVNALKREIFGQENIILHEIEIRQAKCNEYRLMRASEKREKFWSEMKQIIVGTELYTIAAGINIDELDGLYNGVNSNDMYYISMQIILENFTHFLEKHNAVGSIYVEARNSVENSRLQNKYYELLNTGTLFINKNAMQCRLTTINFPLKSDNNIGLQIADFIPNPFAREISGKTQKKPAIHEEIKSKLYCGKCSKPERFGLKQIP